MLTRANGYFGGQSRLADELLFNEGEPLAAELYVMQSQGSVVTCTGRGVVQAEDVLQILKYQDLSNATLFFSFLRSDPSH